MVAINEPVMSVEEFIEQFDEAPFEFINGERIPLPLNVFGHGSVATKLSTPLGTYTDLKGLGEVFTEVVFILPTQERRDWMKGSRVPDVMFIQAERLAAYKAANLDWASRPLALVPDLAVEIISPTDKFVDVTGKIAIYLQDGVRLIWLINQELRTVTIYKPGSKQQLILNENDTLSGEDVIPGFAIPIANLFT